MIGYLGTRVCKQPIIALYLEFENELKFYNLGPDLGLFYFAHMYTMECGTILQMKIGTFLLAHTLSV